MVSHFSLIKTTPSQSMSGVHKGMGLKASFFFFRSNNAPVFPFIDNYLEVSDGDKLC